jgi:gamma-glutamylputrescine oxidase
MPVKSSAYELSYWERETFFRSIDVAIIGSGIVGFHAALAIKERSPALRVAVLERGALPAGASTRNAGFACFGSMSELLDDMEKQEEDAVWALVEKRWRGLQRLRERLGDLALEYREWGGFELFRPEEQRRYETCAALIPDFNGQMKRITGKQEIYRPVDDRLSEFGFGQTTHLILNRAEGQIHTGKMMKALLEQAREKGVALFYGLGVSALESTSSGAVIHTEQGWEIRAGKVLVATNGFARRLLPELPVLPARNQVLITEPVDNLPVKGCFHYDRGFFYFRNIDGRILLGGGRNLAEQEEQTDEFGTTELIRQALLDMLHRVVLPGRPVAVDTWWSGILGVGGPKEPIVKEVAENIYAAVRLGGMGVAIGALVGEEGARLVLE